MKRLVIGATRVPTSKLHRRFEKPGNFDRAVADFESLQPQGAHDFKMPAGVCKPCISQYFRYEGITRKFFVFNK